MINKTMKGVMSLALPVIMLVSCASAVAAAGSAGITVNTYGADKVDNSINLTKNSNPQQTATNLINYALGLLSLIAVVIVMIGGFKWMTAMGNEEKIGEAKKLLVAGLVGLCIILLAWVIAYFVINTIVTQSAGV